MLKWITIIYNLEGETKSASIWCTKQLVRSHPVVGVGVMVLPEETWLSVFTGLGCREELGLTLIWRNKGRARAASYLCVEEKPIITIMSSSSHFVGPWLKAVCMCVYVWLCRHTVCMYCVVHNLLFDCLRSGSVFIANFKLCISRNRQCGEKACYSSPQTLVGAHRFHSPCRQCAGSAGVEDEAY